MKTLPTLLRISLAAAASVGLAAVLPLGAAVAQDASEAMATPVVAPEHGDWTLKEREDWLRSKLDQAHGHHDLDDHEFDRVKHELNGIHDDEGVMRDHHDGQLTDNQTADLEARLDDVAAKIHWLHENSFERPW